MAASVPKIQSIAAAQQRVLPAFRVGDAVRVHYRIREGEKERVQVFQGVVIRRAGGKSDTGATFTVRKMSFGIGVERIFPANSPRIEKLEVISRGHVRRGKLFYLRALEGKKARLRESKRNVGWQAELLASAADAEAAEAARQQAAAEPEAQ